MHEITSLIITSLSNFGDKSTFYTIQNTFVDTVVVIFSIKAMNKSFSFNYMKHTLQLFESIDYNNDFICKNVQFNVQ